MFCWTHILGIIEQNLRKVQKDCDGSPLWLIRQAAILIAVYHANSSLYQQSAWSAHNTQNRFFDHTKFCKSVCLNNFFFHIHTRIRWVECWILYQSILKVRNFAGLAVITAQLTYFLTKTLKTPKHEKNGAQFWKSQLLTIAALMKLHSFIPPLLYWSPLS